MSAEASSATNRVLSLEDLAAAVAAMSYDDIEIEDMEWNEELSAFTYSCPCGDVFQISKVLLPVVKSIHLVVRRLCTVTTRMAHISCAAVYAGGASCRRGHCPLPKLFVVHHRHIRPGMYIARLC